MPILLESIAIQAQAKAEQVQAENQRLLEILKEAGIKPTR